MVGFCLRGCWVMLFCKELSLPCLGDIFASDHLQKMLPGTFGDPHLTRYVK